VSEVRLRWDGAVALSRPAACEVERAIQVRSLRRRVVAD
jgi:hypothetical protein